MTANNPAVLYPYVNPQVETLPTQAQLVAATPGVPTNYKYMPEPLRQGPYALQYGLQLLYPLQKQFVSASLRRVVDGVTFGNGGTLSNSTTYTGWMAIPRNCTITGAWVICGTAPASGTNTLALLVGGSAGSTILTSATYNVTAMTNNSLIALPLLSAGSAILDLYASSGSPPALYCAWNAGVQGTAAANCGVFVEFEMDDF